MHIAWWIVKIIINQREVTDLGETSSLEKTLSPLIKKLEQSFDKREAKEWKKRQQGPYTIC